MNTATIISLGNIGKSDAVISGITALTMLGIALAIGLDSFISLILVLLSIPTMLFALACWNPLRGLRDGNRNGDILRA